MFDQSFEATFDEAALGDLSGEYDGEQEGGGWGLELSGGSGGVFSEEQEMDLAAELLGVSDEAELDQFFGKLIRGAGRLAGRFVKSPTGQALGGILKDAARKGLGVLGGAAGKWLGGPGGEGHGSSLATAAGQKWFGLELESMAPEEGEFEVARRFVRLAGEAAKNAAMAPAAAAPVTAARNALAAAAKRHAPGMLRGGASLAIAGGGRTGRWFRRGNKIVVVGV